MQPEGLSAGDLLRRRLFNLLTLASLLLCVGTATLWVRSFFVEDMLISRSRDGVRWVCTSPGYFVIGLELADWKGWEHSFHGLRHETDPPQPVSFHTARMLILSIGPRDKMVRWQWAGFEWISWRPTSGGAFLCRLILPMWAVFLALALLPVSWAVRYRRRASRRLRGQCVTCGYDLRATPDQCPECGSPFAAAPAFAGAGRFPHPP